MRLNRTFNAGVMNKDLEPRLVESGTIRDALNVNISSSEGSEQGGVENELGNVDKSEIGFVADTAMTIGSIAVEEVGCIYWFVNVDDSGTIENYVYEYNQDNNTTTMVLGDTRVGDLNVLNFDREYRITGVNYVDGLLFWTDDKNPPRRVNIQRAKSYGVNGFTEEDINVIVAPPLNAPTVSMSSDPELPNNLRDKFVYFSYRYKYLDGEYSAIAPFSNGAFTPRGFVINGSTGVNEGMENLYNKATISYETGGDNVTDIQLLYRDSESTNVYVIDTIKKEDATGQFEFTNNKKYGPLPSDQVTRLFDNVPLKAKAQDIVGTRLVYGNYVQYFDMKRANGESVKVDFNVDVVSTDITTATSSVKSNRDYEVGIVYLDEYGRSTTAQTCEKNTVYIKPNLATKQNALRVKINHEAPEFASYYRFVVKESKGTYENIFVNYFIEDAGYNYFLVNSADVNKAKIGDYVVLKSSEDTIIGNDDRLKIVAVESLSKDQFGPGLPAIDGVYIKVTATDSINLSNLSENAFTYAVGNGSSRKGVNGSSPIFSNENGQNRKITPVAYVENPIYYPKVYGSTAGEGTMSISRNNQLITSNVKDARYNIVITDIDSSGPKFNYWIWPETEYKNASDTTISSTASTEYEIKDINGNTAFYIKFSNNNTMAIGDRYVVSTRGASGQSIFGPEYGNDRFAVAAASAGDKIGSISGGAIIKIRSSVRTYDTSAQITQNSEQTFTANRDYKNVEEWYFEDRIYKRLKTTKADYVSSDGKLTTSEYPDCTTIFFLRGEVTPQGLIKQKQTPEDQASYGSTLMCSIGSLSVISASNLDGEKDRKVQVFHNFSIAATSGEAQLTMETFPGNITDGIYREIPGTYSITEGRHSGGIQDQYFNSGPFLGQPAITDLQFENCYTFGNGVESIAIRDDFNGIKITQSPRATTEVEDYKQERAGNSLVYSGVYREDTNVNKLNQFNLSLANFKFLDKEFGTVQKLHARDTDLIVFQENKVSKVLFEKNLLSDAAGGGSVASIPQVFGTQIAFGGEYGISENPESFATWGNMMYWADPRRNSVLRMGMDGTQPISDYGMTDYFRDSFISTKGKMKLGGYDPYNGMYVLTSTTQSIDPCEISISRTGLTEPKTSGRVKLFTINATGAWSTTKVDNGSGTTWLSSLTASGSGTQDIYGTLSDNTSGSDRSMYIDVVACGETIRFTLTQVAYDNKTVRVYVVNSEEDFGNVASQTYSYTSSPGAGIKYVDTSLLEGGLALYTSDTDKVGVDKVPVPGDLVTMVAYDEITGVNGGSASPFIPDLGNKCYYYVSNTSYTEQDYDTVIGLATEVTMSPSGGDYVGTFTYSTPSNEQYLYMVWDYRNQAACASSQSYDGSSGYTPMTFDVGSETGVVDVDYTLTSGTVTINVTYDNNIVATTGSIVGPTSGTLTFTKRHTSPTDVIVQVINDAIGGGAYGILVTTNCPTLLPIEIDPTNGDYSNVCNQGSFSTYYTDGASAGTSGARVYTNSTGTSVYNGGDAFHLVQGVNDYVVISSDGYITSTGSCNCLASTEPTGTDANVEIIQGENVNFKLEADEYASYWSISTLATRYLLEGGEYGAVFRGLDMRTALYRNVAVYVGDTKEDTFVDGTVTKVQGDSGSFTKIGPDPSYSLPPGLELDEISGSIKGVPQTLGSWAVDFIATNCIGNSNPFTVRFNVITDRAVESDVTPFSIDTTNSAASSSASCATVTPSYNIMYHDGYYTYPVIGDKIYQSSLANSPFNGNDLWYIMNNGQTAQIDSTGVISAIVDCVQSAYTGDNFVYEANAVDTCASGIYSYSLYYTGTLGVNPGKLYDDIGLTTLSPAGWYKAQGSPAAAYEWDGNDWTGNAYVC